MTNIPPEFMCPISLECMKDPVLAKDGYTYERTAIQAWLQSHQTSPMTRTHLSNHELTPNYALRDAIERWLSTHAQPSAPSNTSTPSNTPIQPKDFTITVRTFDETVALTITPSIEIPMETICIAVLDVSGSMDGAGQSHNQRSEGPEFSRLDLVKHSMKTLAALMNSHYQTNPSSLGLVTFSNSAHVVMPITPMNEFGLARASAAIDSLCADGGTNIWDGLRLAFEQIPTLKHNCQVQILLLTDGEPTKDYIPLLGIETTLRRKLQSIPIRTSIHTFGFGYKLDSKLLEGISTIGGGSYGFIPDCSMVGTVFINWCAKALLTLTHHLSIKVDTEEYSLGDCILGTPQTIVLQKTALTTDSVQVLYDQSQSIHVKCTQSTEPMLHDFYLHKLQTIVKQIKDATSYENAKRIADTHLQSLYHELKCLPNQDEFLTDIQRDIQSTNVNEGQLMKSVETKEWHESWGYNHLIAYHRALVLRQCINFKDKVLQHFAGHEFQSLQDRGITIFSDLPPPQPSIYNHSRTWSNSGTRSIITQPIDMSQYVTAGGGCFGGNCVVLTQEGRPKRVEDLRRGDILWGGHRIRVVVQTHLKKEVPMVKFRTGLLITPWHPIREHPLAPWKFPADMAETTLTHMQSYYNLVLDSGHIVEMNGYQVCTLGHEFVDNEVIRHPYFGTQAVIEDLQLKDGWAEGLVQLIPETIVRNRFTQLVEHF